MKPNALTKTVMLAVVLSVLHVVAASAQIPQLPVPQIVRADTDLSFTQLLIDGIHFGTALPKVTLAGTPLTVVVTPIRTSPPSFPQAGLILRRIASSSPRPYQAHR